MNYRAVFNTIGQILKIVAIILTVPLIVAIVYKEEPKNMLILCGVIVFAALFGFLLTKIKPGDSKLHARDGLAVTGLSWIIMSAICALPLWLSGQIPCYLDALFEIVSGFTTTGMSILSEPASQLTASMLFLRSFTHWVGGMGVLVFVIAVLPASNPTAIHLMKQESPGPQVSKLVSKVKYSAMILYAIYVALTVIMIIMLLLGGMNVFDSLIVAFGTAGTGGFSLYSDSIAAYNSLYVEIVTGVFMLLFGVNFTVYYLLLIGKFREAFKSEELIWYIIIVVLSVFAVACNMANALGGFVHALRYAFFGVASIITTTGYTTMDINALLPFSKCVFLLLMFLGACSGSTCGGTKLIRSIIVFKNAKAKSKSVISPREVSFVKIDGKRVEDSVIGQTYAFFVIYIVAVIATAVLIAASGISFEESFSSALSAVSNIGAQFNITPVSGYAWYCKIAMIFDMLLGRLEVFPILMLFMPNTWRKV